MGNKKSFITIYTPTYNRGYCLHQLYESLCRQSLDSELYEWWVIDDGSTDNTEELVNKWIREAGFIIKYFKQENEGKMAKLNFIHPKLFTELAVCIDSDDYLLDNSLLNIYKVWLSIENKDSIAGLVGLNIFKDKEVVGTSFPKNKKRIKYSDFPSNGVRGDKKFIYKSSILKIYPKYPAFLNEKFPAPGYLYRLIDVDYDLYIINEPLCVIEYLDDGLSKNKFQQFLRAPNSWMFYRQERIRLGVTFKERYRNAIHFVSSCLFANKSIFKNNKYIGLTILAIIPGVILNIYIRFQQNKGVV